MEPTSMEKESTKEETVDERTEEQSLEDFADFCREVYHVPLIVPYDVDEEKVPDLGKQETMDYLESLFGGVVAFTDQLQDDKGFQDYFLKGLETYSEGDSYFTEHPQWCSEIEKGLENHYHLVGHQIARALVCLPNSKTSSADNQKIVKDIFEQYHIAFEYVDHWQSQVMFSLLDNNQGDYELLALDLGSAYGIPFNDEHRASMLKDLKDMDPTKPSYQGTKRIMGVNLSTDDSKPAAKPAAEDQGEQSPIQGRLLRDQGDIMTGAPGGDRAIPTASEGKGEPPVGLAVAALPSKRERESDEDEEMDD